MRIIHMIIHQTIAKTSALEQTETLD